MNKLNCWEFMKCGKEPVRDNGGKFETCPIASETLANGLNGGVNGGRICWVIAEVCCEHKVDPHNLQWKYSCFSCEFRFKVMTDEGLLNSAKAIGSYLTNLREYQKNGKLE